MNENIFNLLINEYINFREKLKLAINQSFFFYGLEDCYLIDELWIDNLNFCFKIYKKLEIFLFQKQILNLLMIFLNI